MALRTRPQPRTDCTVCDKPLSRLSYTNRLKKVVALVFCKTCDGYHKWPGRRPR